MLEELVKRIHAAVSPLTSDYEIVLVNDCSPDNSWEKIAEICTDDKRVKGINLSRNFGQPYAITAGLTYAKGDYIAVIDCDLQNKPEDLPAMYEKALVGYDVVSARRVVREDTFLKRLSSAVFHKVYDFLSGFFGTINDFLIVMIACGVHDIFSAMRFTDCNDSAFRSSGTLRILRCAEQLLILYNLCGHMSCKWDQKYSFLFRKSI